MKADIATQNKYKRKQYSAQTDNRAVVTKTEWGSGGVVISALDFRSEGCWFDVQSLSLCCFLRQETLPQIVSLHPGV